MKSYKINFLISFVFLAFCLLGSVFQTPAQNLLLRSCTGLNPLVPAAKIQVTKDGDINFIACNNRTVLLNGHVLNGTGTVINVGLSLPSIFSVTNSPVTGAGTLTATLNSQSANTIFAAPDGAGGTPLFRSLVSNDIPNLNASKINTGIFGVTQIPSLDASKINSGIFTASLIPNLDASKINSGVFPAAQIPNIDASKITGAFPLIRPVVFVNRSTLTASASDTNKVFVAAYGEIIIPNGVAQGAEFTFDAYSETTTSISFPAGTQIWNNTVLKTFAADTVMNLSQNGSVTLTKIDIAYSNEWAVKSINGTITYTN